MRIRILLLAIMSMFYFSSDGQSIGLIGSATPGGWDVDTNMVQDVDSAHLWTLEITLIDGAAKFRQDDSWDVNWGSSDFPKGTGTQGGDDIPVFAGDYMISFNSNTGEYCFDVISNVGIIGDATPGGWDMDTDMYEDQNDSTKFFTTLDLTQGGAKFRADNDWARNWGGPDFPSGVGTLSSADNIPVSKAGKYYITIDTATGEYNFTEILQFASIGIIGDATPGGWDTDTDLTQDEGDPSLWKGTIELTDGLLQFRADDSTEYVWGGGMFPMDTAMVGGDSIDATAGLYDVTFNTETLVYEFLPVIYYETIGLIGDAADGWETDRDMMRSEEDSAVWTLRTELSDGEAKFRADDNWDVSWGAFDFPSGVAIKNAQINIQVTAGEYVIDFNTTTGAYHFQEIVVYDTIGMIGASTENANWDDDIYMERDAVDENLWVIPSTTVTDKTDESEGVKFRVDSDWAINWGNPDDWPSGVAAQDLKNIATVAGTYRVTFRSDDGSYSFDTPSSVTEPLLKTAKLYPNPAKDMLFIELGNEELRGKANIEVFSADGKRVIATTGNAYSKIGINVSSLQSGTYFVKISGDQFLLTKPVSILK